MENKIDFNRLVPIEQYDDSLINSLYSNSFTSDSIVEKTLEESSSIQSTMSTNNENVACSSTTSSSISVTKTSTIELSLNPNYKPNYDVINCDYHGYKIIENFQLDDVRIIIYLLGFSSCIHLYTKIFHITSYY